MGIDVFDELSRSMWNMKRRSLEPLAYVHETENEVIVDMDLPMVKKEDIDLNLVEGGLEVKASLERTVRFHGWGTVQRRHEFKYLYKLVPLPSPVVSEGARATYRKGILRIELKKKREKQHKIPVK